MEHTAMPDTAIHKYLDSDIVFVVMPLWTTTMDLKCKYFFILIDIKHRTLVTNFYA